MRVREGADYPRHRVCGEFISGLGPATIEKLGLGPALERAVELTRLRWYDRKRCLREDRLPAPALGLSRWHLDQALAAAFEAAGGELITGSRQSIRHLERSPVGEVNCAGRRPSRSSEWLGLKCHLAQVHSEVDLEMHMSAGGYVGLSRIEGGRFNLCGLFRNLGIKPVGEEPFVITYLRHCGFDGLLERLRSALPVPGSACSVAALSYQRGASGHSGLRVGDARGLIPPFTGNGMTLALESAALGLGPLQAYAQGSINWESAVRAYQQAARERFGRRLRIARGLHRCLVSPSLFPLTAALARMPVFPFQTLFRLTR